MGLIVELLLGISTPLLHKSCATKKVSSRFHLSLIMKGKNSKKRKRSKQQDDKEKHSELPNRTEHFQDVRIEFQESAQSSANRIFTEKKF